MEVQPIHPIKVFYCYAHEDDALREQLAKQLSPLRRIREITGWFDRDFQAGRDRERESKEHLDAASIILLLISADFMASDYCYTVEMTHALERHRAGTAYVIPILLRPVEWERTPLGGLSPLPTNRVPVTQWANPDAAWLHIVQEISNIVKKLLPKQYLSLQDTGILYTEQGPLSGQIVEKKYLLGNLIGEGGFSHVYEAQNLHIQRRQAVKVLLERHFRKPEFRDRFLREARIVASLEHPCIIHLDDFWVDASHAYLVMPFVSERTLEDILREQQGFLGLDQIVSYLEYICDALTYAHEQGVVHLDLKPSNLLVHKEGRLLLSDFGLAHLMKQGTLEGGASLKMGTPHYMAPEHIQGRPEKRSDIFSLGITLYQMLTGRLPFDGEPLETVLMKNMSKSPPALRAIRPELPQAIQHVLAKAHAKQPEQRFQTAHDLLIAFKKALISSQDNRNKLFPSSLVNNLIAFKNALIPSQEQTLLPQHSSREGISQAQLDNRVSPITEEEQKSRKSHKRIRASEVTRTLKQAQTFQAQGRFQEAIDLCEQILESGFDRPDAHYFLGWLYQEQQRWDEAIHQFQLLLDDPDYALSCYYALGQCYRARGNLRIATDHFDEAVDLINLDALTIEESDQLVQLCQETAEAHRMLGEQDQALTVYNALLGFLKSRGWSEKVAQVESMLQQANSAPAAPPPVQPDPPPPPAASTVDGEDLPDWQIGMLGDPEKTQMAPPKAAQPPVPEPPR